MEASFHWVIFFLLCRCLKEKGEIAFLNDRVIFETAGNNPDDFELLCPQNNGFGELTRRSLEDFEECSWGVSPGNAIVVSSAMSMEMREAIQIFLKKAVDVYGGYTSMDNETSFSEQMSDHKFRLFESSPKYGEISMECVA